MAHKKLLLSSLLLAVSSAALAGQITLKGSSKLGANPDYIDVSVDIQSKCYSSEKAVLTATNGAASDIKAIMKSYMSTASESRDQVIAVPGATTRSTLQVYHPDTHRNIVICENGWHSSNSVRLKLANISAWPKLQRDILAVIDHYTLANEELANTSLVLHQPAPQLYESTRENLMNKAESLALASASAKYKRIAEQCELFNPRIVSIQPEMNVFPVAYSRASAAGDSPEVPEFEAEYDMIWVRAAWNITWNFVDSGAGCSFPSDE